MPGVQTEQVLINESGVVYLVGEDGGFPHQLEMGDYCSGGLFVSPDNKTVGCVAWTASGYQSLQIAALRSDEVVGARFVTLSPESWYQSLAWSPDGRYLAAQIICVNCAVQNQPEVDIFYSPPSHAAFTLAVVLTSHLFTADNCCRADSVEWASTSELGLWHWNKDQLTMTPVSLADALQTFDNSAPPEPAALSVPSKDFTPFTLDSGPNAAPFLTLTGLEYDSARDAFLYTLSARPSTHSLMDLRTASSADIFTSPAGDHIQDAAWMPDGRHVLIVLGGDQYVDCGDYPVSDVYLYTVQPSTNAPLRARRRRPPSARPGAR